MFNLQRGWPFVPLGPAKAAPQWKLAGIDAFAGSERPLAWIDDNHGVAVEEWAVERPGPTLLVGTEPHIGMTAEHARVLRQPARGARLAASWRPAAGSSPSRGRRSFLA